jgi:hypothetical protein
MRTQRRAVRKLLPGQPAGGTAPDETRPSRSRKPSLKLLETVQPKKVCALDCCTPPVEADGEPHSVLVGERRKGPEFEAGWKSDATILGERYRLRGQLMVCVGADETWREAICGASTAEEPSSQEAPHQAGAKVQGY